MYHWYSVDRCKRHTHHVTTTAHDETSCHSKNAIMPKQKNEIEIKQVPALVATAKTRGSLVRVCECVGEVGGREPRGASCWVQLEGWLSPPPPWGGPCGGHVASVCSCVWRAATAGRGGAGRGRGRQCNATRFGMKVPACCACML